MIELRDSEGRENFVQEGESANIKSTFVFEGTAFDKSALLTLVCDLYDKRTKQTINGRKNQDILDANDGSVSASGELTLRLGPSDNVIVDPTNVAEGSVEGHVLRLTWTWNDGVKTRTGIEELLFFVERLRSIT